MLSDLLTALALVFVIEGLLPFASPSRYRAAVLTTASLSAIHLRLVGLSSMIAGVVLLTLVR